MPEFLVEAYVSWTDGAAAAQNAERARLAADEIAREGTPVRLLRSIFVPEDETCFYLYEAVSAESVRLAAERAALSYDRLREAQTETQTPSEGGER